MAMNTHTPVSTYIEMTLIELSRWATIMNEVLER
nr:MAG TPA: hypothetical protein [Caudoviricetes sp.]